MTSRRRVNSVGLPDLSWLLLEALPARGIPVGSKDLQELQQLLQSDPALDWQELRTYLRALLAHDQEQVAQLEGALRDWELLTARRLEGNAPDGVVPLARPQRTESAGHADNAPQATPPAQVRSRWLRAASLSVLLAVASVFWLDYGQKRNNGGTSPEVPSNGVNASGGSGTVNTGSVTSSSAPTPNRDLRPSDWPATVTRPSLTITWRPYRIEARPEILLVFGVCSLGLALLSRRRIRAADLRLRIEPLPAPASEHVDYSLKEAPQDQPLIHRSSKLHQTAWSIARHRQPDLPAELDLHGSVERTAQCAGLFNPVYRQPLGERQVWVWRDQTLEDPALTRWADELFVALRQRGLEPREAHFARQPSEFRLDYGTLATLSNLDEQRSEAKVLVLPRLENLSRPKHHAAWSALRHWPHLVLVHSSESAEQHQVAAAEHGLRSLGCEEALLFLTELEPRGLATSAPRASLTAQAVRWGELQRTSTHRWELLLALLGPCSQTELQQCRQALAIPEDANLLDLPPWVLGASSDVDREAEGSRLLRAHMHVAREPLRRHWARGSQGATGVAQDQSPFVGSDLERCLTAARRLLAARQRQQKNDFMAAGGNLLGPAAYGQAPAAVNGSNPGSTTKSMALDWLRQPEFQLGLLERGLLWLVDDPARAARLLSRLPAARRPALAQRLSRYRPAPSGSSAPQTQSDPEHGNSPSRPLPWSRDDLDDVTRHRLFELGLRFPQGPAREPNPRPALIRRAAALALLGLGLGLVGAAGVGQSERWGPLVDTEAMPVGGIVQVLTAPPPWQSAEEFRQPTVVPGSPGWVLLGSSGRLEWLPIPVGRRGVLREGPQVTRKTIQPYLLSGQSKPGAFLVTAVSSGVQALPGRGQRPLVSLAVLLTTDLAGDAESLSQYPEHPAWKLADQLLRDGVASAVLLGQYALQAFVEAYRNSSASKAASVLAAEQLAAMNPAAIDRWDLSSQVLASLLNPVSKTSAARLGQCLILDFTPSDQSEFGTSAPKLRVDALLGFSLEEALEQRLPKTSIGRWLPIAWAQPGGEAAVFAALERLAGDGEQTSIEFSDWAKVEGWAHGVLGADEADPRARFEVPQTDDWLKRLLPMVSIPGGTFQMGSPQELVDRGIAYFDETPGHSVQLSDYWIGSTEVTRELWREAVKRGERAGLDQELLERVKQDRVWLPDGSDGRLPANRVSWYQAAAFCNLLSSLSGLEPCYQADDWSADEPRVSWGANSLDGYRLPTEAEWEYACRGQKAETQDLPWFFGARTNDEARADLGKYAWWNDGSENSGADQVHPVGRLEANPAGLIDIYGNCREWCWDWYGKYPVDFQENPRGVEVSEPDEGSRVLRGGSAWVTDPRYLRSASRDMYWPSGRRDDVGFRLVRSSPRQP